MSELYTKVWIDEHLSTLDEWKQEAYLGFANTVADADNTYPCVPGRYGFLHNHMRFAFLEDPRNFASRVALAKALKEFGQNAAQYGHYTSCVVFFETPDDLSNYRVLAFEKLYWSILSDLHQLDTKGWPQHISLNTDHFSWEFCFDGEPYFAFCTTPSHIHRKSRHSRYFTMAFQPRFVFAELNDKTAYGRKLKKIIRDRLDAYDDVPIHPALGWYGQQDNHEWQQYFLRDDNSSPARCPFMHASADVSSDIMTTNQNEQ